MRLRDYASLILRVGFGLGMVSLHGWSKLTSYSEKKEKFSDPLNVGSKNSMILTIFAEVVAAIMVVLGFKTRFAAAILFAEMSTAFIKVHAGQSLSDREASGKYAIAFLAVALLGPGRYSADTLIYNRLSKHNPIRWVFKP